MWCWLRGVDLGELVHRSRAIEAALAPALRVASIVDALQYEDSRDLAGDEDGTEKPQGEDAPPSAHVKRAGPDLRALRL